MKLFKKKTGKKIPTGRDMEEDKIAAAPSTTHRVST